MNYAQMCVRREYRGYDFPFESFITLQVENYFKTIIRQGVFYAYYYYVRCSDKKCMYLPYVD